MNEQEFGILVGAILTIGLIIQVVINPPIYDPNVTDDLEYLEHAGR